ncbi:hypothetical protein N0V93_008734 [Gnomoniopsis smithogilvyi]|uniref:Uncharacterized protein n=1 Tax=Gnomoniopsis smithogilvyi TaxID=1191159 RepID=A0A9W9CV60_9PEZI|nr:hypothetical protein N0V93_008734 [Gnomoniopsis smithogilvyi]
MANLNSTFIPAICYSTCDSAFIDAQTLGKSPELCESTSNFTQLLDSCDTCIDGYGGSDKTTDRSYLDSQFASFISFCEATNATNPSSIETLGIPTSYLSAYGTLVKTVLSLTQGDIVSTPTFYVSTTATTTLPAYFTHLSIVALISSYIPEDVISKFAASVSVLAPAASVTGVPSSLIYSALENGSPPAWFTSAIPVTYTAQISTLEASIEALRVTTSTFNSTGTLPQQSTGAPTSPSSSASVPTSTSSHPTSKAWIAGAVVGAIAGTALLAMGALLFWRRRKRRGLDEKPTLRDADGDKTWGKAQLHGESLAVPAPRLYELDGEHHSRELPVVEYPRELSAAEIAHELPNDARELPAERKV